MSRHLPLITTAMFCLGFVALHLAITPHLMQPSSGLLGGDGVEVTADDKPDFAAIKPVSKRKKAFFAFLDDYIHARNQEILALRERIEKRTVEEAEWQQLAKRYRVRSEDPEEIRTQLLLKVDTLPPSLVKAQAAMESAWGTSRFAVEGNNYFGQWCFREGCGLVPESRGEDKDHEVRLFTSPQASVNSYMHNLNSHRAYRHLRQARAEQRQQAEALKGCYLARGLVSYSEKGEQYVETIKQLIRVNKLEPDPRGYCAPVMLADEEADTAPREEAATQPSEEANEIAVDDSQSQLIPTPKPNIPPSS